MRSPFGGGSGSDSNDTAEDAQDEFASGGDFFDEPFDPGPTDSAEEAQDEFAGGGGGRFDDDDDDDPVRQPTDTAEDAQDTFAGGGGGSDDRLEPPTDPPEETVDQPQEPLDPDLGDTVSQAEAREVIERSAETGRPVQNLEERGALSAQIEGLTGVDPRTVASETGRDVGLRDGRLTLEGDPAGQRRRRRSQVTEVNQDIEDDLGSAESAQDAFAAGLLGSPTLGTEDAAEGAQDLGAGGLLGRDRISPRRSGAIDSFDAEAAEDAFGALNAEDIRNDPAEAAQDTAARTARRGERFGDIDFSFGFGGPEDEVEEFTDETLPSTIGDAGEAVGLDVLRDRLTDPPRVDAAPPGRLGAATSPASGGGFVAESLFRVGEDLAQLPAQGLEAVELAEFLAEPAVRDGGESSLPSGVVQVPTGNIEESTTRAGQVGTAAAGVGAAAVQTARDNPRQFASDIAVSSALTPLRVSRLRLPVEDGGTTSVRTLQTRGPGIGGRNLAGQATGRPEVGTPSVDPDIVDFTRLGGRADRAFEPVGQLETDIFRATARAEGGQPARRSGAQQDLLDELDRTRSPTTADFEVETAEELVAEARRVPDDAAGPIAEALRDLGDDAVVFGSGVTNAQVPGFRTPNDIDLAVRDKQAAQARLGDALADSNAEVGDVFDIKEVEGDPGKFRGGEPLKFGLTSRDPLEFDGIQVNDFVEETIRKTGAAGFVRGRGAPRGADDPRALPEQFDIGPQPRRPGRVDTRQKDVDDTITLARELDEVSDETAEEFAEAFGRRRQPVSDDLVGDVEAARQVRDVVDDDLGDVAEGATVRTTRERSGRPQDGDDLDPSPRSDRSPGSSRGPSPDRSPEARTPVPVVGSSSGVSGGTGEDLEPLIGSSSGSPAPTRDSLSPVPPLDTPTDMQAGATAVPTGSPGGGGSTLDRTPPTPGSGGPGSPPDSPDVPPEVPISPPPGEPDDDIPVFTPRPRPSIQGDENEDEEGLFTAIDDTGILNPVRRLSEVDDDLVDSLDTFEGDNAN